MSLTGSRIPLPILGATANGLIFLFDNSNKHFANACLLRKILCPLLQNLTQS
jgi:hypothetical protein